MKGGPIESNLLQLGWSLEDGFITSTLVTLMHLETFTVAIWGGS